MKPPKRQAEDYLARGFRNVDAAAVSKMARCLAYMDGLPGFSAIQDHNPGDDEAAARAPSSPTLVADWASMFGVWLSWWDRRGAQSV